MKRLEIIFFALILLSSFSSFDHAFGIIANGTFICTNDTKNEIQFYHDINKAIQSRVDVYLQQRPGDVDGAQNYLNNVLKNDISGIYWNHSKECVQSLGYDTSTVNPFTVPEFSSLSGFIIATSIIGIIIISTKFRFLF